MLSTKNRLRRKKDIEKVLKEGNGFYKDFLVLKARKNKERESRFGFIVSQKVSKKAVIRNRIKRRFREVVKGMIKKTNKNTDIILIALPGTETKNFEEIKLTIEKLFKKANILNL